MNLLFGAAVKTRMNWLQNQGVALPPESATYRPLELSKILEILDAAR